MFSEHDYRISDVLFEKIMLMLLSVAFAVRYPGTTILSDLDIIYCAKHFKETLGATWEIKQLNWKRAMIMMPTLLTLTELSVVFMATPVQPLTRKLASWRLWGFNDNAIHLGAVGAIWHVTIVVITQTTTLVPQALSQVIVTHLKIRHP